MAAIEVQHYRNRARDFLDGMNFLKDDLDVYGYSAALLGIHGAVSYCDALRIGLGSTDLASEDHRTAIADLTSRLASRRIDRL